MDTFIALAEPRRREIIEMLATHGELSSSEIGGRFRITLPAISQHLKVLREANLVQVEKRAQQRIYKLNTKPILEMEDWLREMTKLWNERFDALDRVLQEEKARLRIKLRTGKKKLLTISKK